MRWLNFNCSDQVDPFNRQALSLDMVIPHTELKTKISEWLDEQIKETSLTQHDTEMSSETYKEMTAEKGKEMEGEENEEIKTENVVDEQLKNTVDSTKEE